MDSQAAHRRLPRPEGLGPCSPHPGMEQGRCASDTPGSRSLGPSACFQEYLGSQGLSRPRPAHVRGPRGAGQCALARPLWSVPSLSSPGCCVGGKSRHSWCCRKSHGGGECRWVESDVLSPECKALYWILTLKQLVTATHEDTCLFLMSSARGFCLYKPLSLPQRALSVLPQSMSSE